VKEPAGVEAIEGSRLDLRGEFSSKSGDFAQRFEFWFFGTKSGDFAQLGLIDYFGSYEKKLVLFVGFNDYAGGVFANHFAAGS
jgi:hypothetical protein